MDPNGWYRVDSSKVAHETIDGEVIMIHLTLGNYFSLDGAGAEVWELLARGRSRDQIVAALESRYDADPAEITQMLEELVRRLAEEELVAPVPADAAPAEAPPADEVEGPAPAEKLPLKTPELQKYTDMQDFLLVDPIHEVDEAGWPTRRQPAA